LGWGGVEKKMAIMVLVKPRWNHHNISDFQRMFSGKYVLSLTTFIENDAMTEIFILEQKQGFSRARTGCQGARKTSHDGRVENQPL